MKVLVNKTNVKIVKDNTVFNKGEYNLTELEFEFTEEYENIPCYAIFNDTYKVYIVDNKCKIPYEVLQNKGAVKLGVCGYIEDEDGLVLRYSPNPTVFAILDGSCNDNLVYPTSIPTEQVNYSKVANKPKINDIELEGNKTLEELGINIPVNLSELYNDREFVNLEEINDAGFIQDPNYVHTDNNYTDDDKTKIEAMFGDYVTEERVAEMIQQAINNL